MATKRIAGWHQDMAKRLKGLPVTRGGYDEIMATKLERTIRREITIDGEPYTVAVSPDGLRLTKKRFRSGVEMSWKTIWTQGDRRDEPPVEGESG